VYLLVWNSRVLPVTSRSGVIRLRVSDASKTTTHAVVVVIVVVVVVEPDPLLVFTRARFVVVVNA